MRNQRRYVAGLATIALLLGISHAAYAQGGPGPMGRGPMGHGRVGHGPGGFGWKGCGRMLMHPEMLKAKLGLTDAQVARLQSIRTNVMSKQIQARAEAQQLQLKQRELFQADLPDQNKVLDGMRKVRAVRGRMAEERVKAHLAMLSTLTKEQRAQLRSQCLAAGPGQGQWGGKGMGRGWGRRGGHGGEAY